MKILKIILKNFSAIKNATSANEIEIDFSLAVNKICLLIGPNGSGKTTLLSMFHPFADLGNLDVRNGNDFLLEDMDGYKEIHIRDGENKYIIKHFYTPHKGKSHSVKSYIEKNGVELNVNGNVSSFKEYVKEELQIEPDYLKLIRLGANVTSLIDLTTTERKNFMSKILDDIGIYLDYYKSVNTKLRQLDDMMSHMQDKLNHTGIEDKKEYKKKIKALESEISELESDIEEESSKLAIYNNEISSIENSDTLHSDLMKITRKFNKMTDIMENKDNIDSLDINVYKNSIIDLDKKISVAETELSLREQLISRNIEKLNSLMESKHDLTIQYNKELNSNEEIAEMDKTLTQMRLKLREYENNIGEYDAKYTLSDIEKFILFLQSSQQILDRTYEFGKPPIKKVISLLRENKSVQNYINKNMIGISDSDDSSTVFLNRLQKLVESEDKVMTDCDKNCKAKKLFYQIKNLLDSAPEDDVKEDSSFLRDMSMIYNNIMVFLPKFSEYKDIIDKLPDDVKDWFTIENIYKNIENVKPIYDDKKINDLLSLARENDSYYKLLKDYSDTEVILDKLKESSKISYLKNQIDSVENDIDDIRDENDRLKKEISSLNEQIVDDNRTMESTSDIIEALERYDEIRELYTNMSKDYEKLSKNTAFAKESSLKIEKMRLSLGVLRERYQNHIITLSNYESLSKDLKLYSKIYDEMKLVKDALSSKEGIPLHFITRYLGDTESITNELLDIAYDGSIYIDKFQISPTEFAIPFYNHGVRLSDVKYASQGELSFLTLALSFALSYQAISRYNIMLWDEIDGALDARNREKFIDIVENQIDRVNSEQNFLITHNNMFSSYPVDILDLSFTNNSENYPLANFIEIIRK